MSPQSIIPCIFCTCIYLYMYIDKYKITKYRIYKKKSINLVSEWNKKKIKNYSRLQTFCGIISATFNFRVSNTGYNNIRSLNVKKTQLYCAFYFLFRTEASCMCTCCLRFWNSFVWCMGVHGRVAKFYITVCMRFNVSSFFTWQKLINSWILEVWTILWTRLLFFLVW